jgi:hypothetical protein
MCTSLANVEVKSQDKIEERLFLCHRKKLWHLKKKEAN